MSQNKVVIIDVGVSNLFNVRRGFEKVGADVVVTANAQEILDAPKVVLPGVGAFKMAMANLQRHDLLDTITRYAKSGKPLFGICLGMQLLLTESEEHGHCHGLNLVPGKVTRFQTPEAGESAFKIPQIGWNRIDANSEGASWTGTILDDLGADPFVYFVHSYCCAPTNKKDSLGLTAYGLDRFCSVLQHENISGCQFHPERSGQTGLKILKNFMKQA